MVVLTRMSMDAKVGRGHDKLVECATWSLEGDATDVQENAGGFASRIGAKAGCWTLLVAAGVISLKQGPRHPWLEGAGVRKGRFFGFDSF